MLAAWLVLAVAAKAEPPTPSNQTLLFYNARLALREERPAEALKLWLLRNSVADQEGAVGAFDPDFRSVLWASTGKLNICQDGLIHDDLGGAGLWPLGLHNWTVGSMGKGSLPDLPSPFDAFDVSRQNRKISLHDVLTVQELRTVVFRRTECIRVNTTLAGLNETLRLDPADRLSVGTVLRRLLKLSLTTLDREKVKSVAVIEARMFDLDLAMDQLYARKMKRESNVVMRQARQAGVGDIAADEAAKVRILPWGEKSPQATFLRKTLTWPASDWQSLTRERRLFLFQQARPYAESLDAVRPLVLANIDAQLDAGGSEELETWVAHLEASEVIARRIDVFAGERGKRLLALEPSSGFRERAPIALHRGVAALEAGQIPEALRSFGFAMAHADESREANAVGSLGRRWLSYVLSRFQTNDEMLATVSALVPRQEYNAVLEDLLWRAALRADSASFERAAASVHHGGALDNRIDKLRPLSKGDPGALATVLRDAALDEPHLTLRFSKLLLERLEAEDADVRMANVPMLEQLKSVLDVMVDKSGRAKSQSKAAEELIGRTEAVLQGLGIFDKSTAAKARALAVRHETFAGNIRLAPADPLPWPFTVPAAQPAAVFAPLKLEPVEWRDENQKRVFGWKVTE